jgi:hypothetical protein
LSEIRANTISDAAGTGPIALTKQSAAKATCSYYHNSGTPTVVDSTNVSSLTDEDVGVAWVNFTSNMSSTAYVTASSGWAYSTWAGGAVTATGAYYADKFYLAHRENGSLVDCTASTSPLAAIVTGDLA